jgi:hypothetical protein
MTPIWVAWGWIQSPNDAAFALGGYGHFVEPCWHFFMGFSYLLCTFARKNIKNESWILQTAQGILFSLFMCSDRKLIYGSPFDIISHL